MQAAPGFQRFPIKSDCGSHIRGSRILIPEVIMKDVLKCVVSAVLAAVLALSPVTAYAQNDETEQALRTVSEFTRADANGASYSSVLYDSSSGLPTSDANAIVQTSNGFVWIGSYSGLIRYDGNEFYRYDSSYGVPNVISLFEDSKQRLWIGTNDSGVVCYDNGEFTLYDNVEGLKSSSVRAFAETSDGNIIVATKMGIANIGSDNVMHVVDEPQLNTEDVRELKNSIDGVIYGNTNTGSFFAMDELHITAFYSDTDLGIGHVSAVCPDTSQSGYIYLGTSGSEIVHGSIADGMTNFTVTDVSPLLSINEIMYVGGSLWICADNGIGYIRSDGSFHILENVPMNNSIDGIMCDYEGNLWFVSSRQGVMKISPSDFIDVNKAAGLGDMVVNSTCINNGDLYIGTDTGLHILDPVTYTEKTNDVGELLANARVRCIKNDSKGNIWFSTYSGLVCKKKDGGIVVFDEDSGFGTNKVRVSEELSDGRIAVSTNSGVYFIKDFEIERNVSSSSGLANVEILSICEGDNGQVLLGSNGSGLYVIDGNSVTRIPKNEDRSTNEGLKSDVILRIKKDEYTGVYWMISSSSLSYMKDGEIRTVSEFPYSNNFDIFFDSNGAAWVLSSNGIYVTTSEMLMADRDIEYMFYDTGCGLPSVATANSRSFLTENGDIYISGNRGVSLINMSSLTADSSDIRLTIPFIEADGKLIGIHGDRVTIPADTQRITVYGYALTYSLKNPRLNYMLSGFDREMMSSLRQEMKPVSYTNLKGGDYTFKLGLVDPITGAEQKSTYVVITKEKSLIEQFWFQTLIVILAGIAVFLIFELIHRRREARLIREQERKQMLIDEMIQAFAKCVDMKDEYTNGHSFRVAEYSKLIAEKCGRTDAEVRQVYNVALLHDIGKISIPDSVLNKPGKPTDEEYEILKTHALNGYNVLKDITIAPELAYGAGYHHERLDGKGYPNGLKGDEIPDVAQMIAVADTFDAMYSTRPYRKQMDVHVVLDELKRVSGTQLNGDYVNCLVELVEEGKIGQREL